MKVEGQSWIADLCIAAALQRFLFFRVLLNWFVFDVFCVLGSGFGVFFLISSRRSPPLSAGAGLGTQAALLWHRTRFLSFGAGVRLLPAFFVLPTSLPLSAEPWSGYSGH